MLNDGGVGDFGTVGGFGTIGGGAIDIGNGGGLGGTIDVGVGVDVKGAIGVWTKCVEGAADIIGDSKDVCETILWLLIGWDDVWVIQLFLARILEFVSGTKFIPAYSKPFDCIIQCE